MDSNNFVSGGPGGYTVVVNGKPGGTYASQSDAEMVYNQMQSAGPVPTYPNTTMTAPGFTSGTGPTYTTTHSGSLTVDQMLSGLDQAAGGYWNGNRNDPNAVLSGFNGAFNDPGAAAGGGTLGGYSYNKDAGEAAYQAAALAAQTAYQQALIKGASDRLAFDSADAAYKNSLTLAGVTGVWNGAPTLAATTQAEQNAIAQGQLAVNQGQLSGTYNGLPTEAAREANNTASIGYLGLLKGMSGPANAFDYAHVLTGTPGGLADIVRAAGGQYQMPSFGGGGNQAVAPLSIQSMINDVNRYSPTASTPGSSGPTTGYVPTYAPPPTVPAMPTEPTGGPLGSPNLPPQMGGTGPAPAPAAPTGSPGLPTGSAGLGDPPQTTGTGPQGGGQNLAVNLPVVRSYSPPAFNGTAVDGGNGRQIPFNAAQGAAQSAYQGAYQQMGSGMPQYGGQAIPQASWNLPASQGQASQTGQSYIPQYGKLVPPSQIAPQSWNRMSPSQQQLLIGAYGQGANGQTPYLPQDVAALYQQSLKGYGGPAQGAVGF